MAEYTLFANMQPADIRRAAARKQQWATTPQLIYSHMAAGMTYSQAVHAAARETGLDGATLDLAWRQQHRRAVRQAKAARDAEIRRRARAGESPATIAARLGLHPKTVRRVIECPVIEPRAAAVLEGRRRVDWLACLRHERRSIPPASIGQPGPPSP